MYFPVAHDNPPPPHHLLQFSTRTSCWQQTAPALYLFLLNKRPCFPLRAQHHQAFKKERRKEIVSQFSPGFICILSASLKLLTQITTPGRKALMFSCMAPQQIQSRCYENTAQSATANSVKLIFPCLPLTVYAH